MTTKNTRGRLRVEALESREMMSVTSPWFDGDLLVVPTDDKATSVRLTQSAYAVVVTETTTGHFWTAPVTWIGRVKFQGGGGNDRPRQ